MICLWAIVLFTFLLTVPTQIGKEKTNEKTKQEKITNVEVSDKTVKGNKSRKMGVDDTDFNINHSSKFHLLDLGKREILNKR